MTDEEAPFDRQPNESSQAFEAWLLYRDQPPQQGRSLRRVAQALHKSLTLIGRWSAVWEWQSRAERWDVVVERRTRQAKRAQAVEALLAYQTEMGNQSRALNIIASGLMRVSSEDIQRRVVSPEPLSGSELASIARAVASLAEAAASLQAVSLSVPQLLAALQDEG